MRVQNIHIEISSFHYRRSIETFPVGNDRATESFDIKRLIKLLTLSQTQNASEKKRENNNMFLGETCSETRQQTSSKYSREGKGEMWKGENKSEK